MPWILSRRVVSFARRLSTAPATASDVVLRPYQEGAIKACTDALAGGASRIGVSLPTGSGKTTVFLSLLSRISTASSSPDATRALVIVNAVELAQQAAAQAARLFPEWSVEIEQGAKHKATGLADLTVATYQTLLQPDRLAKFDPRGLKAIVIDEAHHAAAPSYRRLLAHFDPGIASPDADASPPPPRASTHTHKIPIIGVSATFSRHDGLALGSVFEQIVYHHDFLSMIKDQWLSAVRFTTVRADIDLSAVTVSSRSGDFQASSLAHVINTRPVNELVLQTWLDKAADRKSTLVFCVSLAHVRDLTECFRQAGVDARYLHSGTPSAERQLLISDFKAGKFPVLVNCAILTEGADIPNIDCVLVAKPTRSRNIFAQMIGRGMRLSPDTGKVDCRIIDFVESRQRVEGVVSTPTLFGLDPAEVIDNASTEDLIDYGTHDEATRLAAPSPPSENVPAATAVTYVDFDDPFNFFDGASGAPHLAGLSPNAWVGCGGDVFVLELLGRGHVRVERVADAGEEGSPAFKGYYVPAALDKGTARGLKISPFLRARQVLTADDLRTALRSCDAYVEKKVLPGQLYSGLRRTARWREQPATDAQKALVRARWKVPAVEAFGDGLGDKRARITEMKKGEAANILTRLRHGAQARYEEKLKSARKVAAQAAKETSRRAREHVQVGPLRA